eukprot:TRINITY_DN39134_c0_g1_i1.p1 TRINITY_DN39134_c0_g1~~TRINITY_DN39134_c0_g1_i1.p1  ORF type:complete len:206 (+),score=49.97 TRINITY_DN39134_c0_g1_i1:38-655(+)
MPRQPGQCGTGAHSTNTWCGYDEEGNPLPAGPPPVEATARLVGKADRKGMDAILARLKNIEKQSFNKEDSMVATLHKEVAKVSNRLVIAERAVPAGSVQSPDGIVGYLIYSNNLKQEGCSRVLKIAVEKASRRQGVGSLLLQEACALSRAEHSPAMQLHVALSRGPAFELYRKHGFAVLSTLPDYYAPGRDAHLMEKPLVETRRA